MAKLRKIQFYRNGQASVVTGSTVVDLKSAYKQAEQDFIETGRYNDMLDGEILLYRFSYDGQVHTLVGVVHATVPQEGEQSTKSLEVLANYDMLGGEISAAITAALAELDGTATIATVANGVVTLKAGVKQTAGEIGQGDGTDITLAKVATTGAAADVAVATVTGLVANNVQEALDELQGDINAINGKTITAVENQAVEVTTAENGNTTIGLKLVDGEKVLSQTAAGLKTTLTVDTIKYPTENTAEGYVAEKAGKTYIQIKGVNGELISETDAAAFVKDGFLQSVTKDTEKNELVFTWNTDVGVQETTISIKDLCDVYTVGEGLVATEDGYKFSHQAGATGLDTTKAFGSGSATDNKITVKVPSVTVDKFGHVSALSETEVSLEIPASVATAVQTVNGDTYVSATKTGTDVTLATKTKTVADAAANDDGLATALDVKTYVDAKVGAEYTATGELSMSNGRVITHNTKVGLPTEAQGSVLTDVITHIPTIKVPVITVNEYGHVTTLTETPYEVKYPTVSGKSGHIVITTAAPDNAGINYTVSLAEVARVDNPTAEGTAGLPSASSFADENNKFTYVKEVKTDDYGRVTGILTETVTEDFDAGTY